MDNLPDILSQLQFISYETVLLGFFLTASVILVVRDWRLLILALLGQYVLVGLMLSRLVRPDIAVLTVMIGAFVCPILFLSARQVSATPLSVSTGTLRQPDAGVGALGWLRRQWFSRLLLGADRRQPLAPTGFYFRLFMALLLLLVTITVSQSFPLPGFSGAITTAIYWLALSGLIVLTLTEDPLKAGHGLFTIFSGFSIYYVTLERSLLLIGMWGAVNLLLALAIGYLTVVRGAGPEEEL